MDEEIRVALLAAQKALTTLEWEYTERNMIIYDTKECPICAVREGQPHDDDCELGIALAKIKALGL